MELNTMVPFIEYYIIDFKKMKDRSSKSINSWEGKVQGIFHIDYSFDNFGLYYFYILLQDFIKWQSLVFRPW